MIKKHIDSLSGLKVLALVVVFWVHAWMPKVDGCVGVVIMNYFFCCSGFLVAARYWDDASFDGFPAALGYLRRKLVQIYPIYALGIVIFLLGVGSKRLATEQLWYDVLCNALMLQSWGTGLERLQFSINGATWFLSSVMFCYFIAPLVLSVLRRMRTTAIPFAVLTGLMLLVEFLRRSYPNQYFEVDLYTNPAFRALEFSGAMCAYPLSRRLSALFANLRDGWRRMMFASAMELAVIATWTALYGNCLRRFTVAGAMCLCLVSILVFVLDAGCLSRVLSQKPFRLLATIELEFYVLHMAVLSVVRKHLFAAKCFSDEFSHLWTPWAALALTLVLSVLFHRFCRPFAARGMDALLSVISRLMFRNVVAGGK